MFQLFKLLFGLSGEKTHIFLSFFKHCLLDCITVFLWSSLDGPGLLVVLASGFVWLCTLQLLYTYQYINAWIKETYIICLKSLFNCWQVETLPTSQNNKTNKLMWTWCPPVLVSRFQLSGYIVWAVFQWGNLKWWPYLQLSCLFPTTKSLLAKTSKNPQRFRLSPSAWPPLSSSPQSSPAAPATPAADSPAGGSSQKRWAP